MKLSLPKRFALFMILLFAILFSSVVSSAQTFGKDVMRERNALDLTRLDLAKKAGTSLQVIVDVEEHNKVPSNPRIVRNISLALKCIPVLEQEYPIGIAKITEATIDSLGAVKLRSTYKRRKRSSETYE